MKEQYDCLVIGGGPGGSTTAALVAMAGYSVLLVERDTFPRYHVGESLMPETYWVLQRLGVIDKLHSRNFVRNLGVRFADSRGVAYQTFHFPPPGSSPCVQTWQVDRAAFDQLLFDHAAELGAQCLDQTRVLQVLFENDRAVGVTLQPVEQSPRDVAARVVVDATGQQALLAHRLGLKVEYPDLHNAAIWGYYRNASRDPSEQGNIKLVLHTHEKQSWFWFLPLQDGITGIGVVGPRDYLLRGRGTLAEIFEDELVKCPALVERLMNAELASEFRVAGEFSYRTTRQAGDGWVLVGDAWGFIDPIFASGVYFAMKSAEHAANAICEGLETNDTSTKQLSRWVDDFHSGTKWLHKLATAFYNKEFHIDSFLAAHPEHYTSLVDILSGRIFHADADQIFNDLDAELRQLRADSSDAPR